MQKIQKNQPNQLLELISYYNKVVGYNVNTQKSTTCLYISKKQVEFEVENTLLFTLAHPQNKIGIDLTKYVQGLYEEDYK
uniref:Macaca fascicularis brain cDNA, clone: QflA-22518 n=1 Tax=Macaca fascicularis TaxID=9541 RepID=I7GDH7_MACFA|nr:unnamed protein product [Macaca fascicularis]